MLKTVKVRRYPNQPQKQLLEQSFGNCRWLWLKLTYSQCLQQGCIHLGTAFNNFFEQRAGYPRFKSKHDQQSIQYPQNVKVLENALTLPKIGEVKAILHRPMKGNVKTVTVTKNRCDQYFASILFEDGKPNPNLSAEGKAIGIDLGLTDFAVTSDGSKFNNPRLPGGFSAQAIA